MNGYPLAAGFLERCVRYAGGRAVKREEHGRFGRAGVVVRVIEIIIAGQPFRVVVLHRGRGRAADAVTAVAAGVVAAHCSCSTGGRAAAAGSGDGGGDGGGGCGDGGDSGGNGR